MSALERGEKSRLAWKVFVTVFIGILLFHVTCSTARSGGEMIPVFDKDAEQVAWLEGNGNLFDLELRWVGFLAHGNFFNPNTLVWLGPFHKGSLLDRSGKPVAWVKGSDPEGTLRPLEPLTPLKPLKPLTPLEALKPLKPLTPLTPLGGWSNMPWQQWIAQK